MKEHFLKIRIPMLITNIIICISMVVQLSSAIRDGSKERMIGSSIVLALSIIAIIIFLVTHNKRKKVV